METAHSLALILATLTPGAIRNTSGMLMAPERRIISLVITNTAAGDLPTVLGERETVLTSVLSDPPECETRTSVSFETSCSASLSKESKSSPVEAVAGPERRAEAAGVWGPSVANRTF